MTGCITWASGRPAGSKTARRALAAEGGGAFHRLAAHSAFLPLLMAAPAPALPPAAARAPLPLLSLLPLVESDWDPPQVRSATHKGPHILVLGVVVLEAESNAALVSKLHWCVSLLAAKCIYHLRLLLIASPGSCTTKTDALDVLNVALLPAPVGARAPRAYVGHLQADDVSQQSRLAVSQLAAALVATQTGAAPAAAIAPEAAEFGR